MTDRPDISVVIPGYNSADALPELVERLRNVFVEAELRYEIILVNDASKDDTWATIERLNAADPRVRGIDLLSNHGQPLATVCGLAASRGELVATMDDDLQHQPEELPVMLAALDENPGWDAVVGTWTRAGSAKGIGSWVHGFADRLAWGTPKGYRHTAFRLMRRPTVDALVANQTVAPVVGPMLYRSSSEVHNVEVEHASRAYGSSGFSFGDGIRPVVTNFTHGSMLPLHAISGMGLVVAMTSFLVGVLVTLRWILGSRPPAGWLSVFLATLLLSGLILFSFGILGQYISLIVSEVRGTPRWSVRREVGHDDHQNRTSTDEVRDL